MRARFSCAASILLMAAVVVSAGQQTAPRTAKDEAIPALRDARVIVLRHVRSIDGTGAPAKEDQALAIEGGKIIAVGRDGTIDIPEGARGAPSKNRPTGILQAYPLADSGESRACSYRYGPLRNARCWNYARRRARAARFSART